MNAMIRRRIILAVALTSVLLPAVACGETTAPSGESPSLRDLRVTPDDVACVATVVFKIYDLYSIWHGHEPSPVEKTLLASLDIAKDCVKPAVTTYQILNSNTTSQRIPTLRPFSTFAVPFLRTPVPVVPVASPTATLPTPTPTLHPILPLNYVDIEHELGSDKQPIEHSMPAQAVTTNTLPNCDSSPEPVTVTLTVPFQMTISSKSTDPNEANATFTSESLDQLVSSTGLTWSDTQRIAWALYTSDKIKQQFLLPPGTPTAELKATIPPRTKQAFVVNYTLYYRVGGAIVSWFTGKRGQVHSWLYDDGAWPTSVLPVNPVPVTSTDCP